MTSPIKIGDTRLVYFPCVDKNNTVELNDRRISQDYYLVNCLIERHVTLNEPCYTKLCNNLLTDSPVWGGVGGATLTEESRQLFAALCAEYGVGPEEHQKWMNIEEVFSWFKQHKLVSVVAVSRVEAIPTSLLFVNTEGHSYARTVGRDYVPFFHPLPV